MPGIVIHLTVVVGGVGANRENPGSFKELVGMIARLTGSEGRIVWDPSKPDGQPRRRLDVSRAEQFFGFRAKTGFEDGLRRTVEWYREKQAEVKVKAE